MKIKDPDILEIVSKLRGVFPNRIYIGGSYAINTIFPQIPYDDIDIFIVSNPFMESWALKTLLNTTIFDSVNSNINAFGYYKIQGQYLYLQGFSKHRKYDLIFLKEGTYLPDTCGSTLSSIFYTPKHTGSKDNILFNISSNESVLKTLLFDRVCKIRKEQCTDSYMDKTIKRCELLDLRVKY